MRYFIGLILALALGVMGCSDSGDMDSKYDVRVMSLRPGNGTDYDQAADAQTLGELLRIGAQIHKETLESDYALRAQAQADMVLAERPDLIALAAIIDIEVTGPGAVGVDQISILTEALAERGLNYSIVSQQQAMDIPMLPLLHPLCDVEDVGACLIKMNGFDMILKNDDNPDLEVSNPQAAHFDNQVYFPTPAGDISFNRGWVSIDVVVNGERDFRLVNTRVDRATYEDVQALQVQELIDGPSNFDGGVVLAFTSNSAGGTSSALDTLMGAGYEDTDITGAPDPTCCQVPQLTNPESQLDQRDTYVLTKGEFRAGGTYVMGDEPLQSEHPYWQSIHAQVFADVRVLPD